MRLREPFGNRFSDDGTDFRNALQLVDVGGRERLELFESACQQRRRALADVPKPEAVNQAPQIVRRLLSISATRFVPTFPSLRGRVRSDLASRGVTTSCSSCGAVSV